MSDVATQVEEAPVGETRAFEALAVVEGRWTGDERIVMVDALSWDGLLPMCLTIDHEGVDEIVGRIDELERMPGASDGERFIFARGVIDLGGERGVEAARLIEGQFLRGVSIEPDAIREGGVDPEEAEEAGYSWPLVVESGRIRAASLVTTPAFAEAYITFEKVSLLNLPPPVDGPTPLNSEQMPEPEDDDEGIIIVAAGHTITIPALPPAEWFSEPLDVFIEGALTVTDDGRVYGLLAPANTPFIGNPSVVGVPMGNVDYSRFTRGEALVDGGHRVVAGNITMGCGHSKGVTAASLMEHHDNSCSVVAQVAVGERHVDPPGVWVAGALLPGVTADQVQRMMACQLSGEWLGRADGSYELLAALLVPVPAFAMGRRAASVTARAGKLVASAIPVQFEDCGCGGGCAECSEEQFADPYGELLRRVEALELRSDLLEPVVLQALRTQMEI